MSLSVIFNEPAVLLTGQRQRVAKQQSNRLEAEYFAREKQIAASA